MAPFCTEITVITYLLSNRWDQAGKIFQDIGYSWPQENPRTSRRWRSLKMCISYQVIPLLYQCKFKAIILVYWALHCISHISDHTEETIWQSMHIFVLINFTMWQAIGTTILIRQCDVSVDMTEGFISPRHGTSIGNRWFYHMISMVNVRICCLEYTETTLRIQKW